MRTDRSRATKNLEQNSPAKQQHSFARHTKAPALPATGLFLCNCLTYGCECRHSLSPNPSRWRRSNAFRFARLASQFCLWVRQKKLTENSPPPPNEMWTISLLFVVRLPGRPMHFVALQLAAKTQWKFAEIAFESSMICRCFCCSDAGTSPMHRCSRSLPIECIYLTCSLSRSLSLFLSRRLCFFPHSHRCRHFISVSAIPPSVLRSKFSLRCAK